MTDRTLSYVDRGAAGDETFVAPYLVIALECERPLERPARLSLAEVDRALIGRGDARTWSRNTAEGHAELRVAIPDSWMSTRHALVERGEHGWLVRDAGSKNGTFLNGRSVAESPLADGDLIETGSTLLYFRDRARRSALDPPDAVGGAGAAHPVLATLNPDLGRRLVPLTRLATSGVSLVLGGESGTGKELTVRAVHELSGRGGPFVAVNCGALPDALVEAELFGARRGAFSGASEDRIGLVRAAHRGTLFLDEIGDLPLASQVKLLRVLQEAEVTPLGATQPIAVDVRVVAASHRDLRALVAAGSFRADLFARLAGAEVTLSPLRERREDIGLLTSVLLGRIGGDDAGRLRFERDAARALFLHDWPLNARELEQALRAAVAIATDGRIALAHLPEAVRRSIRTGTASSEEGALRSELLRLLAEHQGNISAVARAMGKARVQVRRWCRRFGIDPEGYRPGA